MRDNISIEVAEKLQKAGYEGECSHHWVKFNSGWHLTTILKMGDTYLPAPTATQLAEELPSNTTTMRLDENAGEEWLCENSVLNVFDIKAPTLPDALGLMMVYLLENRLIN